LGDLFAKYDQASGQWQFFGNGVIGFWQLSTFSSLGSQVEYSPAIIPWMGRENPGNLPDHNWDRGIWLAARRSVAASTPLHIIGIKFIPCLKG